MASTANAGRPSAPRGLRIIQGGTTKDGKPIDSGGRHIEDGPNFDRALPAKPTHLSKDADWLWDRVIEQMKDTGILKPLDGPALEAACETFARWREAVQRRQKYGMLGKNSQGVVTAPWVGIEERASKEFRAWCSEFGITPAAERHLRAESPGNNATDNPF